MRSLRAVASAKRKRSSGSEIDVFSVLSISQVMPVSSADRLGANPLLTSVSPRLRGGCSAVAFPFGELGIINRQHYYALEVFSCQSVPHFTIAPSLSARA